MGNESIKMPRFRIKTVSLDALPDTALILFCRPPCRFFVDFLSALCLSLTFQNNYRGNLHSVCSFKAVVQYTYMGDSNITVSRHGFKFSLVGFDRNYSAYL